jgi:hypothetical protein
MISRCPCRKCLVEPVCKNPCDDFSKFAGPLNDMIDRFENFFGGIDDFLTGSRLGDIYDWIGEYFILPGTFYLFTKVLSIKTEMEGSSLFDERLSLWDDRRTKKQ